MIDDSVSSTAQGVIRINDGTTIAGVLDGNGTPTVVFELMSSAPTSVFGVQRGILGPKTHYGSDIEIWGIKFDGNKDSQIVDHGDGYHNFFGGSWVDVSNLTIHECYVRDSQGDGVRNGQYGCSNINIYNFNVDYCGHDAIFLLFASDIVIHDCKTILRSNSCCRLRSCQNADVYNLEAYTETGVTAYSPGIEIHSNSGDTALLQNISIHDCYVKGTFGPGIQIVNNTSNESKDIYVYNCIFKDCGKMPSAVTTVDNVGGIIAEGIKNLQILNNTFDGCLGYTVGICNYDLASSVSGCTVYVKNNIFMNTVASAVDGGSMSYNGTAVINLKTTTHTVYSSYNCFYNNVLNYKNVSGSNDLTATNPLVYDATNGDYHLKSQYGRWDGSAWVTDVTHSPCIDAGDPSSDYSSEPSDGNGGRVNVGAYGNTAEASKSLGSSTSNGILYVGFNSEDSDIICDGTADNIQIQQALDAVRDNSLYTTVHLRIGTYDIASPLLVYSNTILEGEAGAILRVTDNAGFAQLIPIINQGVGSGIQDVELRNFEINGNKANQTEPETQMYYNAIYWLYADGVKLHDLVIHDCLNDGIRLKYASNADVYNCVVYECGNISINMFESSYVSVHDNNVRSRIESGIRVIDTNHAEVYGNIIEGEDASDGDISGISIIHTKTIDMNDVNVYENSIYSTHGAGIMAYSFGSDSADLTGACNLHIHHNILKGCGTRDDIIHCAGIAVQGWHSCLIEHNDIDGCYRYGIVAITGTGWTAALGTGYEIEVRNNIISGILEGGSSPTGTGVGIANTLTSTHTVNAHHNCVYNSAAANYLGITPANDINVDPLWFAPDMDDYHLKSVNGRWNGYTWERDDITSPCIDAGDPASDYSNELEGNGSRINIGRYGNTAEASLSSSAPIWTEYYSVGRESGLDFYCDGKDDQVQINLALIQASNSTSTKTVLLKAGTYTITDTINVPTGITLAGESGVIVQLASGLSWATNKPMIQVADSAANVRISSFTMDGNRDAYPSITSGQYYYNLIMADGCSGIEIDSMVLRNNHNDAANLHSCTAVRYHDNVVDRCGHDGLYCTGCSDIKAYNNVIQCRTNAGIRLYNSNEAELYNNEIFSSNEGGAGIQLQQYGTGIMTDIIVRNNLIYTTKGPGIWLYGGNASAVSNTAVQIYDNVFYDDATGQASNGFYGGILAWGWNAEIEYNIFDGNYGAGIQINQIAGYTDSAGTGYEINISNCIISNSRDPFGFSVRHYLSDDHDVAVSNCCLYNCPGGILDNISTSGNVTTDPMYKDRTNHDYTLLSSSPMYSAFSGHTVGLLTSSSGGDTGGDTGGDEDEPTPDSVGTEVIDGRSIIYAEYVPESTLGTTPGAPVFRSFPGDLTKIVITSGAEFDEFEILRPPSDTDRLNCGVSVKTVEKMHTVKVYCKPSSLGLIGYAICAADTANYTGPGISVWPCTIGVRVGSKYTAIRGCVLQSAKYEFKDMKSTADLVLTFYGISRTDWRTTDYAASGSHLTAPTTAPYTLSSLSNLQYDSGDPEDKGIIVDSLSFGFENKIDPILSTSGLVDSKIVGWKYGAASIPLKLGISLTDTTIQDSVKAGNAHTLVFALGGKTFTFSSIKWSNDADLDAGAGAGIGIELEAAAKAVRVVFA